MNRGLYFSRHRKSGGSSCWPGSAAQWCGTQLGFFPGVLWTILSTLAFCHFLVKSLIAGAWVITTVSKQKGREGATRLPLLTCLPLFRKQKLPRSPQQPGTSSHPQNWVLCQNNPSPEAEPTYPNAWTKPGFFQQKEGQGRLSLVFEAKSYM